MTQGDNIYAVRAGGDFAPALYRHVSTQTGQAAATDKTRRRLWLARLLFTACFVLLIGRLGQLTLEQEAIAVLAKTKPAATKLARPIITDRNEVILATQINMTILGADAAAINNGDALAEKLDALLPDFNLRRAKKLLGGNSRYVILKTGLSPTQREAVLHLGNPHLRFASRPHRVYPTGAVAAHITGFAGADMQGLAGLEREIDSDKFADKSTTTAEHFATTIDIRVQHIVRDALQRAQDQFKTKAAAAAVMDVSNGEILALVSLPDFDANRPPPSNATAHFNRMTLGVYELGSVFKIFTAALALESGAVSLSETFDAAEPLKIGRHEITDVHGQNRELTINEIVTYSSNIGSAQLALRVPPLTHYNFLADLFFTEPLDFQLPETATPIFPSRWTDIERATSSYGHGLAITPLHALVATAAMVNGGILYEPSLQRVDEAVGRRVISPATSARVRKIMRAVIADGTGGKADVEGYPVLGKTGSANQPRGGGYSDDALITSFVGAFPAHEPRYALLVMLDEPQGNHKTHGLALAGWNAAPTAAEIIRRSAPLLGLLPRLRDPQAKIELRDPQAKIEEVANAS